nr:hypothetical protein [Tanacetum cinerariifolium]
MEHQNNLTDFVPPTPYDLHLSRGHTPGSDEVNTATTEVSAASASVTTAGVSISTAEPRTSPTTITTVFKDEDLTIAQTLVKMRNKKAKEKRVAFRDLQDINLKNKNNSPLKKKSRMLVKMIAERKRFFAAQRVAEQRSKPPTKLI